MRGMLAHWRRRGRIASKAGWSCMCAQRRLRWPREGWAREAHAAGDEPRFRPDLPSLSAPPGHLRLRSDATTEYSLR